MDDRAMEPHNNSKPRQATRILRLAFLTLVIINLAIVFYKFIFDEKGEATTIAKIENIDPKDHLTADGRYSGPFEGDSIILKGLIENNATTATYKDAVLEITYHNARIGPILSKVFTANDIFPPASKKSFAVKVASYDNIAFIDWKIINASVE